MSERRLVRQLTSKLVAAEGLWRTLHRLLRLQAAAAGRTVPLERLPTSLTHVIVLGARVRRDGAASGVLRERLERTLEIAAARPELRVLASGDGSAAAGQETETMRNYLVDRGLDPARIDLDGEGLSTRRSLQRAAKARVRGAVIVTNDFHLPRALHVAVLCGIDAWTLGRWSDRSYSDAHRPLQLDERRERPAHVKDRLVLLTHRSPLNGLSRGR